MSSDSGAEPGVAVVCACGGAIMMAVRQYLGPNDKRDIGNYAAEGYEIRQLPVSEIRLLKWCKCHEKQGTLPLVIAAHEGDNRKGAGE